jgi:hypothetical protein
MPGCPYCGEMHSQLYVCDEMRKARAKSVTNAVDTVTNAAVDKPLVTPKPRPSVTHERQRSANAARVARWQKAHPEACREKMRQWRRARAENVKAKPWLN